MFALISGSCLGVMIVDPALKPLVGILMVVSVSRDSSLARTSCGRVDGAGHPRVGHKGMDSRKVDSLSFLAITNYFNRYLRLRYDGSPGRHNRGRLLRRREARWQPQQFARIYARSPNSLLVRVTAHRKLECAQVDCGGQTLGVTGSDQQGHDLGVLRFVAGAFKRGLHCYH